MDTSKMIEHLEDTSLFEIYQTSVLLRKILNDPKRIAKVRAQLTPHQVVSYLGARTHRETAATVVQLGRTNVLLKSHQDGAQWRVPYYMINLAGITSPSPVRSGKVDSLSLRVGDSVGFVDKQNQSVYGVVQKLNRKTASIKLQNGQAWRVAYELLFYVMEAVSIRTPQKNPTIILA